MPMNSTYRLPAVMDATGASGLKSYLLEHIAQGGDVVIDAEAVERVSTPAMQCLMAAKLQFAEIGRNFLILRPAPCLQAAIADMGIHKLIGEIGT